VNFELDRQYLKIQRQAQDFARAIEPVAAQADEMSEIHPGVLAALKASGLSDLMVPAEYGGRTERLDPLAICVVREVLMATSAHADSMFALQGIGSYAITVAGSAEQCGRWLPKVAAAEALPALALTEPDAGASICMEEFQHSIEQLLAGPQLSATQTALLHEILAYSDSLLA